MNTSKVLSIAAKTIGITAAGAVLYDAGKYASRWAENAQDNILQDRLEDRYIAANRLDGTSSLASGIKDRTFKWQLDNNMPEFFGGIKAFVKSGTDSLANNIIPVTLATASIAFSKNAVGKLSAIGLVGVGIKRLFYDVWGIGKSG